MSIQQTFPLPGDKLYMYRYRINKDGRAMEWMGHLRDCMYTNQKFGIEYAQGSWGYTVLRTAYSEEAELLWPTALDRLTRWVAQYFVHIERLGMNKSDGSVNEELGRRFVIEVVEATGAPGDANETLKKHAHLYKASQEDINALTDVFESWRRQYYMDQADSILEHRPQNPRFCDFLVIDEDSVRSLASLPDETPSLELVSREERRGRMILYEGIYVWLVDSQAVRRFQGVEDVDHYSGWMKLDSSYIPEAWFERVSNHDNEIRMFRRRQIPLGSGDLWFEAS